jgi:hypothetical protein
MSTDALSHDFLAPPALSPSGGQVVDPGATVVSWNAPGAERIEIIIEQEDLGPRRSALLNCLIVPLQRLARGPQGRTTASLHREPAAHRPETRSARPSTGSGTERTPSCVASSSRYWCRDVAVHSIHAGFLGGATIVFGGRIDSNRVMRVDVSNAAQGEP